MKAFLACATQWRVATLPTQSGGRLVFIGLDYAGTRSGLEAAGIAITPELWHGLRIMEEAALQPLNGMAG